MTSGATEYNGPVVVTTFQFGGQPLRLIRPADPDRLLDAPEVIDWNRRDDYMPYWAYLWPAAYLLAEAVAREPWSARRGDAGFEPLEALEIGCGLGLAGLAGLSRGLRVQFSDYDPAPLDFVARSAAANGFEPSQFITRVLDWRNLPDEQFSIILGADVIYEARLVPLVANLLGKLLAPGGLGLIGTPYRVAAQAFPAAITAQGLLCRTVPASARTEDGRPIQGILYRIRRAESEFAGTAPNR
jgi:predicted nicotinamide N-methyase